MRMVKIMLVFLQKFLLLSPNEQKIISHIKAYVGRKKEYNRIDGFIKLPIDVSINAQRFVYEPSADTRLKKLRFTGPYFRIWFTLEKNGDVYFVNFEKLN
jgi:hypothetical protein